MPDSPFDEPKPKRVYPSKKRANGGNGKFPDGIPPPKSQTERRLAVKAQTKQKPWSLTQDDMFDIAFEYYTGQKVGRGNGGEDAAFNVRRSLQLAGYSEAETKRLGGEWYLRKAKDVELYWAAKGGMGKSEAVVHITTMARGIARWMRVRPAETLYDDDGNVIHTAQPDEVYIDLKQMEIDGALGLIKSIKYDKVGRQILEFVDPLAAYAMLMRLMPSWEVQKELPAATTATPEDHKTFADLMKRLAEEARVSAAIPVGPGTEREEEEDNQ